LSPESLTVSRRHSYQNDFWSLGVLAYELLFNIRPFIGPHRCLELFFIHPLPPNNPNLEAALLISSECRFSG
jgi:serine/threonine protein kinase